MKLRYCLSALLTLPFTIPICTAAEWVQIDDFQAH